MARPTKFSEDIAQVIIASFCRGYSLNRTARAINVHRSTLQRWIRWGERGKLRYKGIAKAYRRVQKPLKVSGRSLHRDRYERNYSNDQIGINAASKIGAALDDGFVPHESRKLALQILQAELDAAEEAEISWEEQDVS